VLEVDEYDAWGIDTPEDLEKFRKHIEEIES
jgi:CMP-2-keto-3-deoxyoctulosonic acid synthetase